MLHNNNNAWCVCRKRIAKFVKMFLASSWADRVQHLSCVLYLTGYPEKREKVSNKWKSVAYRHRPVVIRENLFFFCEFQMWPPMSVIHVCDILLLYYIWLRGRTNIRIIIRRMKWLYYIVKKKPKPESLHSSHETTPRRCNAIKESKLFASYFYFYIFPFECAFVIPRAAHERGAAHTYTGLYPYNPRTQTQKVPNYATSWWWCSVPVPYVRVHDGRQSVTIPIFFILCKTVTTEKDILCIKYKVYHIINTITSNNIL